MIEKYVWNWYEIFVCTYNAFGTNFHTWNLYETCMKIPCMKFSYIFHVRNLFQTHCMYIQKFHTYFHTFHTLLSWLGYQNNTYQNFTYALKIRDIMPVKIRGFASRTRVFSSMVHEDENVISRIPLPRQNKLEALKSRDLVLGLEISKPRVFFCEEIDPRDTISSPRFARGFKTSLKKFSRSKKPRKKISSIQKRDRVISRVLSRGRNIED